MAMFKLVGTLYRLRKLTTLYVVLETVFKLNKQMKRRQQSKINRE
jgi:hypothetical protein